jgi:hypothetical protein
MGNSYCYAPVEYRNYKKAKGSSATDNIRHFIWGCNSKEASFMYFVDIKSKRFQQLVVPQNISLYNFSAGLMINDDQIAIVGGVSFSMRKIASSFYIYSIKGHFFKTMGPMLTPRFNITTAYIHNRLYAIGGRSFGTSEEAIKSTCEVYSFSTNTWKTIASLNIGRSGCKSIVYRSRIYVIGGNNFEHKGNRIEFYEPQNDTWTLLEVKLPFDYFNFGIFPGGNDEVLIMGGAFCKGYMKNIHAINLKKQTIINRGSFIAKRANFKYFFDQKKDELFVLGGVFSGQNNQLIQFEFAERFLFSKANSYFVEFDFKEDKTHMDFYSQNFKQLVIKSEDHISTKEANLIKPMMAGFEMFGKNSMSQPRMNENFHLMSPEPMTPDYINYNEPPERHQNRPQFMSMSNVFQNIQESDENDLNDRITEDDERKMSENIMSLKVDHIPPSSLRMTHLQMHLRKDKRFGSRNFVFGTDNEPFMFYIEKDSLKFKIKPITWKLRLYNHQGAVRISAEEILFAGGVNFLFNRVYEKTFIYNLRTKEIKKLPNMLNNRFFAGFSYYDGKIWAIGGRGYGEDAVAVMNECEAFNFETNSWNLIPSLNNGRCQASSFVLNKRLYIAGGLMRDGKATNTIEVFNSHKNRWELMGIQLSEKLMGFIARPMPDNSLVIIGGMNFVPSFNIETIDFGHGDLFESKINVATYKHCLAKMAVLKNGYLVFGGINHELELLDKQFKSKDLSDKEVDLIHPIDSKLNEVCKESYGLTKCSFITCD